MITVYRWKDAPDYYKALSDHGGDEEHVIVGNGRDFLPDIMRYRDDFDAIVRALDVWDGGMGTVHETIDLDGDPVIVYITAHA